MFDNFLFALKLFDRIIQPTNISFDSENFWIQLHDLPMVCINREIISQIGSSIARLIQVDVSINDVGWGSFLRVRVDIDFHKPLACGHFIKVNSSHMRIPLQYEKLPKICLHCG